MEPKIYGVLVVVLSLQLTVVSGDTAHVCPDFTATFVAVLDQDIDFPTIIPDSSTPSSRRYWDSEITTFNTHLKML